MSQVIDFLRQILRGKTIYRVLFNWQVRQLTQPISGPVLDLASGWCPSYLRYLPPSIQLVKTDYPWRQGIDTVVDINQNLPFANESYSTIFFFNALYIIKKRDSFYEEVFRILRPGGQIILSMPFVSSEISEPDDYVRLTAQGLRTELMQAGFRDVVIKRFGERCTASAYLLHPFYYFNFIRCLVYALAMVGDKLIPKKLKDQHPTPLGYMVIAKK